MSWIACQLLAASLAAAPAEATRLQEIEIEGRLQLPEVLFISAHEPPRYFDRLHHDYLHPVFAVSDSSGAAAPVLLAPIELRSNLIPTTLERYVNPGGSAR